MEENRKYDLIDDENQFEDEYNNEMDFENNDEDLELDHYKKEIKNLSIKTVDKELADLHRMIKENVVIIQPTFQREYVWGKKNASRFIESLYLGFPVPPIFVIEKEDGLLEVIDGQQRLTSIKLFLDNELKLSKLEVLGNFSGKKFDDLSEEEQRKLKGKSLSVTKIDSSSDEGLKFDLFARINQGAVKLNEQELRNCLYHGSLTDAVIEMGKNEKIQIILENFKAIRNRQLHLEIIERFFTIDEIINKNWDIEEKSYSGRMKDSINGFMKKNQNADNEKINEFKDKFFKAIENVYLVFGEEAFKLYNEEGKYTNRVNSPVAEMQLLVLSRFEKEEIDKCKSEIKELFENLCVKDQDFVDSLRRATNNTTKINNRYNKFGKGVESIIHERK